MAGKLTALGSECYVGSADISGDIGAVTSMSSPRPTITVTGLNKSAPEKKSGRRDGAMSFAAFFNVDSGAAHATFSALPRTDVLASVALGTPALGGPIASMTCKQLDYAPTVGDDGSIGFTVEMAANGYGLEHGELLTTGKQSFSTGTVNGDSIDLGDTDTSFGAAAYLHVFSVASGTAVFKVQDSDDDVTFADVTGLTFTGATGATSQRLQTGLTATVRQYVRLQGSGTHGAAVVAVNFVRYFDTGPA
ncbi:MAG TPA: hypothetical protein VFI15_07880 [Candidatus Limnocylindrales bacterium]|nr:hypothetical protein [Candidatus Limnocylindrales bacterium]